MEAGEPSRRDPAKQLTWTQRGKSDVWTATPSSTVADLFFDDTREPRPRLPTAKAAAPYFRVVPFTTTPSSTNCSCAKKLDKLVCYDAFQYDTTDDPFATLPANYTDAASCATTKTCALKGNIEVVVFEKYEAARLRIASIDTTNHIVYTTGATSHDATFHTGAYGFLHDHRYLIDNAVASLSSPLTARNQWYFDPTSSTLWFWAPHGVDPTSHVTVTFPSASAATAPFFVANGIHDVVFDGLTFEHGRYGIPPQGYGGKGEAPPAVSVQNSQHVTFESDVFAHMSGDGLELVTCVQAAGQSPAWCTASTTPDMAVNAHNTVEASAFFDIGATAIHIGSGGDPTDTEDNVSHDIVVRNTLVTGYGRSLPGSFGILQNNGHDNTYDHDEISDGYKGAIRVFFGGQDYYPGRIFPHGNTISHDLVHDIFQGILNDGGALYFGVGTVGNVLAGSAGDADAEGGSDDGGTLGDGGTTDDCPTGGGADAGAGPTLCPGSGYDNKMLDNVVHHVVDASIMDEDGYGGHALYADDFSSGVTMERNLVYRVSDAAVNFSGARLPVTKAHPAGIVKNNIFAFARRGMISAGDPYYEHQVPPLPLFFKATNNIFYFDRDAESTTNRPYPGGAAYHAGFFVQGKASGTNPGSSAYDDGGATFITLAPYRGYQIWNDNQYFNCGPTEDFATEAHAFRSVFPLTHALSGFPPNEVYKLFLKFSDWQTDADFLEDTGSAVADPGFGDPTLTDPTTGFSVTTVPPSFVVFDPTTAGRNLSDPIQAVGVQEGFPTQVFDDADF